MSNHPNLVFQRPWYHEEKLAERNDLTDMEGTDNRYPVNLQSERHLRFVLAPLKKEELVDLLVQISKKYPVADEEIRGELSARPTNRKLFVNGLGNRTTSETLRAAFTSDGEIEEGVVIVNQVTGKSRGFGFITFTNIESAQKALENPRRSIDGRMAFCSPAREGFSRASLTADAESRRLFIARLPPDISTETLLSFFERHGEIEEGSVVYDRETDISRGIGFVTYKTTESALKAIFDPDKFLGGKRIIVRPAYITYKKEEIRTQESVPYALRTYNSPYTVNPPHGLLQSQVPYRHVSGNEPHGIPSSFPTPTGISAYPYYHPTNP